MANIGKKEIVGSHGITVSADISDENIEFEAIDLIFLPGGMPGAKNLDESESVQKAIDLATEQNAYIAAICAAPMILGKRGLLNGKNAVCYPSFEKYLFGATVPKNARLVTDGKIITAKGMGVALEFGLELVSVMKDRETSDKIKASIFAK